MKYTVNELRAKTREAFNTAEAGGKVYVERHKKIFELVYQPYVNIKDLGTDLHPSTAARIVKATDINQDNSHFRGIPVKTSSDVPEGMMYIVGDTTPEFLDDKATDMVKRYPRRHGKLENIAPEPVVVPLEKVA